MIREMLVLSVLALGAAAEWVEAKELVQPEVATYGGRVGQPYLGFIGHVSYSVHGRWGMMVDSVTVGSPAWQMGLERGDVIVKVNNWRIRSRHDYLHALRHSGPYVHVLVDDCRGRGLTWDGCFLPSSAPAPCRHGEKP